MSRRRKRFEVFAVFLIFLILSVYLVNSNPVDNYVTQVKETAKTVNMKDGESWRQVEQLAEKINKPPVDAQIDRIWKAIPGYNGVELDVAATYEKWKKTGGHLTREKWVIKELPPARTLEDFPPTEIFRGNPNKPMVAFMVNVAWGTEHIPALLDILDQENIKLTFFLDGSWTNKNSEAALEIAERGHEIGNHAYSHPSMSRLSLSRIYEELDKTNRVIEETTGVKVTLFAPPSGDYDGRVVRAAAERGMKTILWTADTLDWRNPAPADILRRVAPKLDNGVLVLMHPTEPTVKVLRDLINSARQKGLQIGTVSDVISPDHLLTLEN